MAELRYWAALVRAPGLGPRGARSLIERLGSVEAAFSAPAGTLRELGVPESARGWLAAPDWSQVEADLEWASRPGHAMLPADDPRYPALLGELPDPPPVLYLRGDPAVLATPQLAVVGSRHPTPGGRRDALEFARYLAASGLTLTSGLAEGIDAAAHTGALEAGARTIAVAGTGPDRIYPAAHRELAESIAASGAIVSELPPGTPPRRDHFPRRNRIISGLSLGVLIVEAGPRSGSLITARHALDQGREVFAIPGSIHNPLARGCHRLIRDGAKLVETADDVIEDLGALAGVTPTRSRTEPEGGGEGTETLDDEYRNLLECLGFEPTTIDSVVERSGLTPESVSSMLLILELRGLVASTPGGHYTRVK